MVRTISGILAAFLLAAAIASADVVTDWNEHALDAIRADRTAPPRSSRALAMVHLAIYDAVNGILNTHEYYLVAPGAEDNASVEAAAAAAAHAVLSGLFPAQNAIFDAKLATFLETIDDGASKDDGVAWGEKVGAAVLAARAHDGSQLEISYTPGTDPGDWQPTPPGFAASLMPQWPYVTPFGIRSAAYYRGDGPPALTSAQYTADFIEVKAIGSATSALRTAEQSEIALFWVNGPGTATPPGHWNSIAQVVAQEQLNTVAENARLFALLNIALADAAIVAWDNKYAYNDWRPVTAIRAADTDGNDATEADPEWISFIPTPPFPDYTSGHSTFSGAASKVLELFYGRDDIAFETNSDANPEIVRSYESFSQAADESGKSRVYGGIHWEYSNQDGLSSGRAIGEYVSQTQLQEIPETLRPRLCGTLNLGVLTVMMMFVAFRFNSRRA